MINIVTALPSEAKPVIAYYGLEAYSKAKVFRVYHNEAMRLVISGIGKTACAAATGFLFAISEMESQQIWLNIGIAGHRDLPLSSAVLAHKISDFHSAKCWYPPILKKTPLKTAEITTVDVPELSYPTNSLYEMEASGFYDAACRFTTMELAHCIKIVSDNQYSSIKNISAAKISCWIEENLAHIEICLRMLQEIQKDLKQQSLQTPAQWETFLERWHFTVSQQHQLKTLLQRWQTLFPQEDIQQLPLEQQNTSKQVIQLIQKSLNKKNTYDFF